MLKNWIKTSFPLQNVSINYKNQPRVIWAFFLHKIFCFAQDSVNTKEEIMKDCALICFALGLMVGAVIVSNNEKAMEMVEKGKKAVKKQIQKMK